MAKWRRGGGGRRRGRWVIEYVPRDEVRHDGEAGAVPERGGTGCGDGLAASAGVESCAAELLEADAAPAGAETGEEGNAIADGEVVL